MNKSFYLIGCFVLIGVLAVSAFAIAENSTGNSTAIENESISNSTLTNSTLTNITVGNSTLTNVTTKLNVSEKWENRCLKISNLVERKIGMFDDGKVRRSNSYDNLISMLNRSIQRMDAAGANTTQIKVDFAELQARVAVFDSNYSTFILKLKSTQNYTCGHSEGQFAHSLNETRALLPFLRADAKAINDQFKVIKDDMKEIRMQKIEDKREERKEMMENKTERLQNRSDKLQNRSDDLEEKAEKLQNRSDRIQNRSEMMQNKSRMIENESEEEDN